MTKMTLQNIAAFCQQAIEEMAAVFDTNIEIIDNELRFIAAAGRYKDRVGMLLPSYGGRLTIKAIGTKEYIFIDSPENYPLCRDCHNLSKCQGQVEICYPILCDETVAGVISMASVRAEQASMMLQNRETLLLALSFLSRLIGETLQKRASEQQFRSADQLLDTVLNSVNAGAMIVQNGRRITHLNTRCEKLLGFNTSQLDYLYKVKQLKITLQPADERGMTEACIRIRDKTYRFVGTAYPETDAAENGGRLFVLEGAEKPHDIDDLVRQTTTYRFSNLVGGSSAFLRAVDACKNQLYSFNSILLCGESGVGKETLARTVHSEGPRRDNRFIRISTNSDFDEMLGKLLSGPDCLTPSCPEQETCRDLLRGNTLYIAEIGMLNHHNQGLLMSILSSSALLDCKVICATTCNLKQLIAKGDFLKSLYYMIELNTIHVPPLRDRGHDIVLLAEHFIDKYNAIHNRNLTLAKDVVDLFGRYGWHGNIHEMESVVAYIIETHDAIDEQITLQNIPEPLLSRFQISEKPTYNLGNAERDLIIRALNEYGGISSRASVAKALGISVATLYRKLKQYGIQKNNQYD